MLRAKPVARFIWDYRRMGVRFDEGPYMTTNSYGSLALDTDKPYQDVVIGTPMVAIAIFVNVWALGAVREV